MDRRAPIHVYLSGRPYIVRCVASLTLLHYSRSGRWWDQRETLGPPPFSSFSLLSSLVIFVLKSSKYVSRFWKINYRVRELIAPGMDRPERLPIKALIDLCPDYCPGPGAMKSSRSVQ